MPVEESADYIHVRVRQPEEFLDGTMRFVVLSDSLGIYSDMGKLKSDGMSGPMVSQNFLFKKVKGWTIESAAKWVEDHGFTPKNISEEAMAMKNFQQKNAPRIFDIKRMESNILFETKATPVKQGDAIIDYRDVVISGYASTFADITPSDRYGDYIVPGAFAEAIGVYSKNPINLKDHVNSVDNAIARTFKIQEDARGLYVESLLSNAPDTQNVRIKIMEGIIRSLSIGGFFYYLEDGRGIYKVDLFEFSLVAIPANPDALFTVRSLEVSDLDRLLTFATSRNQLENIAESIKAGRVIERKQKDLALNYLATKRGITNAQEISRPGLSVGGLQII